MESDDQTSIPRERRVVGLAENEVHRIPIALDELSVLRFHLRRLIPGQDPAHLIHGDVDALHARRRGHRLGLEVAAEPPFPGTWEHPDVEHLFPSLELIDEGSDLVRLGVGEHHEPMISLKR